MPPATIILALPAFKVSEAINTAFIAEPHSLLMVTAPTWSGTPALRIA